MYIAAVKIPFVAGSHRTEEAAVQYQDMGYGLLTVLTNVGMYM